MKNSITAQISKLLKMGKTAKEIIGMNFKSSTVYHVQVQPMKLSGGGATAPYTLRP